MAQRIMFEDKSVQLVDRITNLMVKDLKEPVSSKDASDYSSACFDAAMILREMLQCWKSKQFHQCCRNSLLVRLARVRATIKQGFSQKILAQELKVKMVKGKWKHVYLSMEPGRIILKDTHGSAQEVLGIDRILSVTINDEDCRAEFEICYGAESYLFRVGHMVQRCLWMHSILRERQICRIDSFVEEQPLAFKEDLLRAIGETDEPVKIDKELLNFLYAEYSEIMENEFAEKLKMEGVSGELLEGKGSEPAEKSLTFQRIGINANKWAIEFELGRAKRMIVTQHEPGGMQFAFAPDEMIGMQHIDEKRECIVRIRIRDRKTTIAVDFETDELYKDFLYAMNWFCYDKPLRQFFHKRLLTHLLSIKYVNSASLQNRDSIHWMIEIMYKSSILTAGTQADHLETHKQKHNLIQLVYDISSRLGFSEIDERRRLQILVRVLATGTIDEVEAKEFDLVSQLPKRPGINNCNCATGHCAILFAKIIEQMNGCELLEHALRRSSVETSLWVLKVLYYVCQLRKNHSLCISPTLRRQASLMLEFRNGAHPFQYYVANLPKKSSQRMVAVVYNMILGRSSIDLHKKITEVIAPDIKHPELIPFLFGLIESKISQSKNILEKFASMMVGKVENTTMLTRIPGCQSWFFPFLLTVDKNADDEKRTHIIKLAVVNIASIIAYDVMGNEVRDVFEMEAWKCIRVLLRFTKWNERGRNVLKMLLGSAGLIIANKVKDYMKKFECDVSQMWKKLARFYFVYCELLLNMPARYALELGEFKVAVDKKGRSLDRNCLIRVIDIGVKIKAAMGNEGSKVRSRIRFSTMVSFLYDVRRTMEKRVHIPGDRVALFNRAVHKLNRASVTMSSMLTSSVKNPYCNVPDVLYEYSKSYFEEKTEQMRRTSVRTKTEPGDIPEEDEGSSSDNEPPPPPPRSPQISIQHATHEWPADSSYMQNSGASVASNDSEEKNKYLKPEAGHKKSVSLDCGKREVTEKTAQMFQNIIASLRQKVESLSAKERKSQQDLFELKSELRAMREHERERMRIELASPTPPPPPGIAQMVEACRIGDLKAVKNGLQSCSATDKDHEGKTMLHHAVYSFDADIFKAVLEAKADVNSTDNLGRTPLHYAVEVGGAGQDLVQLLVEYRADVDAKDKDGITPLDLVYNTERTLSGMLMRHSKTNSPRRTIGKKSGIFDAGFWGKKGRPSSQSEHLTSHTSLGPMEHSQVSMGQNESHANVANPIAGTSHSKILASASSLQQMENVFDGGFWGEEDSHHQPASPSAQKGETIEAHTPAPPAAGASVSEGAPEPEQQQPEEKKAQPEPAPSKEENQEETPTLPADAKATPEGNSSVASEQKGKLANDSPASTHSQVKQAAQKAPPSPAPAVAQGAQKQTVRSDEKVPSVQQDLISPKMISLPRAGITIDDGARPIPTHQCADDVQTQCRELLACISSSHIFTTSIQVTMKRLKNVIQKSGGLNDAKLNVNMLRLMRMKYQKWDQLEEAVGSELLHNFRAELLKHVIDRIQPKVAIETWECRSVLILASEYGLGILKNVAKYGTGAKLKTSMRAFYWDARATFEKQLRRSKEEKSSAIQFLMSHDIFSRQVKVSNSDVDALVAAVIFSRQGIQQGRTLVEGLKMATQAGRKFETFIGLIEAVQMQCNT